MKDERLRILHMVAEGKITPEEAKRLLEALGDTGEGEEGTEGKQAGRDKGADPFAFQFRDFPDCLDEAVSELREVFAGFGSRRRHGNE